MWCKTCNIETNEELCPICGSVTIEDLPTEIYWCAHCEVPIIQVANQVDKGTCPLCAKKLKYLSADLRPVFPEERLLLELLLGEEAFNYVEKFVWAANSRYYINGKSASISRTMFQETDTDALSQKLEQYRGQNTYIRNVLIRALSNGFSQRPIDGSALVAQYNNATYART